MIKEGNVLPEVTWNMYTVSGVSAGGFLAGESNRSWKEYKSTNMFQKQLKRIIMCYCHVTSISFYKSIQFNLHSN